MFFLFSGEGPTDLGLCAGGAGSCDGAGYEYGPMTVIASQIVEERHRYSFLETGNHGFVSKGTLTDRASELKAAKKALRLPGKKRGKETRYFFNNARVMARIAKERETELHDEVVAVLFRDSDGTASAGRGLWPDKRQSMLDGFVEERFFGGVPMIPKPKSEAWIICAVKANSYEACEQLEDRSGNDDSPNSLKKELAEILGGEPTRESLNSMVSHRRVDIRRIDMMSLESFRERLEEVI